MKIGNGNFVARQKSWAKDVVYMLVFCRLEEKAGEWLVSIEGEEASLQHLFLFFRFYESMPIDDIYITCSMGLSSAYPFLVILEGGFLFYLLVRLLAGFLGHPLLCLEDLVETMTCFAIVCEVLKT